MSNFTAFASGFLDAVNQRKYEQRMAKHQQALEDRAQETWQERNQQLQDWDLERDALNRERRLEDIRTVQEREDAAIAEAKANDIQSLTNYYKSRNPDIPEEELAELLELGAEGRELSDNGYRYINGILQSPEDQVLEKSVNYANRFMPPGLGELVWADQPAYHFLVELAISNKGLGGWAELYAQGYRVELVYEKTLENGQPDRSSKVISAEIRSLEPLERGKELDQWKHEAINNAIEGEINSLNNLLDGVTVDENNNPITSGPASRYINRAKGEITERYFAALAEGEDPNIEAIAGDYMQEILPTIKELWNPVIERAEDIWEDYTRDPNTVELNDLLTAYENYRTRLEVSELMPIGQNINELRIRMATILEDPRVIAVLAEAEGAPAEAQPGEQLLAPQLAIEVKEEAERRRAAAEAAADMRGEVVPIPEAVVPPAGAAPVRAAPARRGGLPPVQ